MTVGRFVAMMNTRELSYPSAPSAYLHTYLRTIDVSDPAHPVLADTADLGVEIPSSIIARDGQVFVPRTWYPSGRNVDPPARHRVFTIDPSGHLELASTFSTNGCQVADVLTHDEKLLVSTSDCGLLVLAGPEAVWSVYLPVVSR